MSTIEDVKQVLADVLNLGNRAESLEPESVLLGDLPELDSMAVLSLITGIESRFGFEVDDDEISAEIFETLSTLTEFVEQRLQNV